MNTALIFGAVLGMLPLDGLPVEGGIPFGAMRVADRQTQNPNRPPPCQCARACQLRGTTYNTWADPDGQRQSLSHCQRYNEEVLYDSWVWCNCIDPRQWYGFSTHTPPPGDVTSPNH